MPDHYQVAIVGSGPAGMSAGARAAVRGISHVLLEKADHASDTIYKFQKGKLVMSTPDVLPLRSDVPFDRGQREDILANWNAGLADKKVNVRYNTEVTGITGQKGAFTITLKDKTTITAENVVLSIGLQGNINKVTVPGAEQPHRPRHPCRRLGPVGDPRPPAGHGHRPSGGTSADPA